MWFFYAPILIALLFIWAYFDTRKPKNFPPGPKWYPIIGCAIELENLRRKNGTLSKATGEWAKRYGPLTGAKIGVNRIVFVYGVKALYELFTRDEFNGRPDGVFYTSRTWGKRRGILFTESTFWQEQRKFMLRQLKEIGPGRVGMVDSMKRETFVIVDRIKKLVEDGGGTCVLRMDNFFELHFSNATWAIMTGNLSNADDDQIKRLQAATDLFAQFDMVGPLFSHFPVLRHICPNLSGYNNYITTHRRVCGLIQEEIDKVKAMSEEATDSRGFIDAYLKILRSPEKHDSFTEDQLLAMCLDFFIVASDTSSKVLAISLMYMLLYPEVQRKAQEEIDKVVGNQRFPNIYDRPQLLYVESVFLESLRMFVGSGHILPHKAMVDTHFNGYFIPKDTLLIANPHGNHLDGWENPEVFDPERHIRNGILEVSEHLIPFGLGKHRCVAEGLAKPNLLLVFASLIQKFNFTTVPGDPPSGDFVDGFTPGVNPFKALITLR